MFIFFTIISSVIFVVYAKKSFNTIVYKLQYIISYVYLKYIFKKYKNINEKKKNNNKRLIKICFFFISHREV